MTLDEYARDVGTKLCVFHDQRDRAAVDTLLRSTDEVLARNRIDQQSRKSFWSNVDRSLFAARPAIEKQANSALHALMQSIKVALAARQGGK